MSAIFVSYKYKDNKVQYLVGTGYTTARDYVNVVMNILRSTHQIYVGEKDDEDSDLSYLAESTIEAKLKERIKDSSVTIVLISKGMRETYEKDKNQWIPHEVSYSLRDLPENRRSALIYVVIPDEQGSYSYFEERNNGWWHDDYIYTGNRLFEILERNLNNKKDSFSISKCNYYSDENYAVLVKWDFFKTYPLTTIKKSLEHRDNVDDYNIKVNL